MVLFNRSTVVTLLILAGLSFGCAWESGGGNEDTGVGDSGLKYPRGPYGTGYMETVENLRLEECICTGETAQFKAIYLADFLDAKATLTTVHAGWCTFCKQQATTMERDFYQVYKNRGLEMLLILFQDENHNAGRQILLNFCCQYKRDYEMTFTVAVDPNAELMDQYFRPDESGTPLNMLLDRQMRIRYKVEGLIPDSRILEGNIEGLLDE